MAENLGPFATLSPGQPTGVLSTVGSVPVAASVSVWSRNVARFGGPSPLRGTAGLMVASAVCPHFDAAGAGGRSPIPSAESSHGGRVSAKA